MKFFLILTLSILIVACASPYIPPKAIPPTQWAGEAKFEYQRSTVTTGGSKLVVGDTALKGIVNFSRMAVISEDAETSTAFGGRLIFPKGMPVWGIQYTNFILDRKESDMVDSQADNNPIEWCGVLPKGSDGKAEEPEIYCLFWEAKNQARYIKGYFNKDSIKYIPSYISKSGMAGPMPKIIEINEDLGVSLESELTVMKINKAGIKLLETLRSGEQVRKYKDYYWRWSDSENIHEHMGLRFKLIPSKDFASFKMMLLNNS